MRAYRRGSEENKNNIYPARPCRRGRKRSKNSICPERVCKEGIELVLLPVMPSVSSCEGQESL